MAAAGGILAVIDTSGDLRRFTSEGIPDGRHPVMPPGARRGYPLGLLLRPDGSTLVVHTHEAALVTYDREGRERARIGNGGVREGEFCMPQRAVVSGGRYVVSEFGYEECRRVQVFSPDGTFLRRIGGPGTDAVFERPMGLAVDEAGVLWVADAAHFLWRFDLDSGRLLDRIGGEGGGAGGTRRRGGHGR